MRAKHSFRRSVFCEAKTGLKCLGHSHLVVVEWQANLTSRNSARTLGLAALKHARLSGICVPMGYKLWPVRRPENDVRYPFGKECLRRTVDRNATLRDSISIFFPSKNAEIKLVKGSEDILAQVFVAKTEGDVKYSINYSLLCSGDAPMRSW